VVGCLRGRDNTCFLKVRLKAGPALSRFIHQEYYTICLQPGFSFHKFYLQSTRHNGYFIRISVADTGIGISEESISKIFDDFCRAKNAKKFDREGTGLGLALVKWITDTLNGK
jgi:signal transduction histidine kinase